MLTELMTFSSPENSVAILRRLVGSDGVLGRAGQHQPAVRRLHVDVGAGNGVADRACQLVGIERHLDVDAADQLLVLVEQRDAGGAEVVAEHVEGAVGERIDVGDLGIADDDLVERHIGLDRLRLALGDLDRRGLARRDLDDVASSPAPCSTAGSRASATAASDPGQTPDQPAKTEYRFVPAPIVPSPLPSSPTGPIRRLRHLLRRHHLVGLLLEPARDDHRLEFRPFRLLGRRLRRHRSPRSPQPP